MLIGWVSGAKRGGLFYYLLRFYLGMSFIGLCLGDGVKFLEALVPSGLPFLVCFLEIISYFTCLFTYLHYVRLEGWGGLFLPSVGEDFQNRPIKKKGLEGFTMVIFALPWGDIFISSPWKLVWFLEEKPIKYRPPFYYPATCPRVLLSRKQFFKITNYSYHFLASSGFCSRFWLWFFSGYICLSRIQRSCLPYNLWQVKKSHRYSVCPDFSRCKDGNANI